MRWGLLFAVVMVVIVTVTGCNQENSVDVTEYQQSLQQVSNDFAVQYVLSSSILSFGKDQDKSVLGELTACSLKKRELDFQEEPTEYSELTSCLGRMIYTVDYRSLKIDSVSIDEIYPVYDVDYPVEAVVKLTYTLYSKEYRLEGMPLTLIVAEDDNLSSDQRKAKLEELWKTYQKQDTNVDFAAALKKITLAEPKICTALFDVRYEAVSGKWIFDDDRFTADNELMTAPEWVSCELVSTALPLEVQMIEGRIVDSASLDVLKNYKNGLKLRNKNWLTSEQAEVFDKSMDIIKELNGVPPSVENWEKVLAELAVLNSNIYSMDHVYNKLVDVIKTAIDQWRKEKNTAILIKLKSSMKKNHVLWDQVRDKIESICMDALVEAIGERESRLMEIRNGFEKISLGSGTNINALMDEFARIMKIIKVEIPSEQVAVIERNSSFIFYCKLLQVRDIDAINDLYAKEGIGEMLREQESKLLVACSQCRRSGRQVCISCRTDPGKCSNCKGQRFINDEICSACKGTAICTSCNGKRRITCVSCRGLKVQIVDQKVAELLQNSVQECTKIIDGHLDEIKSIKN